MKIATINPLINIPKNGIKYIAKSITSISPSVYSSFIAIAAKTICKIISSICHPFFDILKY